MATTAVKSANVMVRVEPDVKAEAEAVLEQLGLPVSVVINSLYRQIIMNRGIPFPLTIPAFISAKDSITGEESDHMLGKGSEQEKTDRDLILK